MKDEITSNAIKTAITIFFASFVAYFSSVAVPLIVLLTVVICDYITGMIKAYANHTLSSRIGFMGIIKKLSYFIVVGVGMICDYLISAGLKQINDNIGDLSIVAIIVIIWLIINELLSILENLSEIGVPLPSFLKKLLQRLLVVTEKKGDEVSSLNGEAPEDEEEEAEAEEDFVEELINETASQESTVEETSNETVNEDVKTEEKSEDAVQDEIIDSEFKGEM